MNSLLLREREVQQRKGLYLLYVFDSRGGEAIPSVGLAPGPFATSSAEPTTSIAYRGHFPG